MIAVCFIMLALATGQEDTPIQQKQAQRLTAGYIIQKLPNRCRANGSFMLAAFMCVSWLTVQYTGNSRCMAPCICQHVMVHVMQCVLRVFPLQDLEQVYWQPGNGAAFLDLVQQLTGRCVQQHLMPEYGMHIRSTALSETLSDMLLRHGWHIQVFL